MALANPEIRLNRFRTVSIVSRRVRFIIHRPRRGAARRVARPEESSSCINRIAQRGATDCSDLINDRRRTVLRLIKRTLRWHWCIAAKIFFSNSMHLLAFVRDRLGRRLPNRIDFWRKSPTRSNAQTFFLSLWNIRNAFSQRVAKTKLTTVKIRELMHMLRRERERLMFIAVEVKMVNERG